MSSGVDPHRSFPNLSHAHGVAWRAIDCGALGAAQQGTYCRSPGWLAWQFDGRLVGVCFRGRLRLRYEDRVVAAIERIADRFSEPCDVIIEVAELAVEPDAPALAIALRALRRTASRLAPKIRRYAVVIGRQGLAPWWCGAHQLAEPSFPWRACESRAEAWSWLGVSDGVVADVDRLLAGDVETPDFVTSVEMALIAAPDRSLAEAAAVLGKSVRTLQRALADAGASFNTLRDAVRFDRARLLLRHEDVKIQGVGHDVGFASHAHFTQWFRRRSGMTPGAYRLTVNGGSTALPETPPPDSGGAGDEP